MKKLIFILLLAIPFVLSAQTNYYISSSEGDDANNGTSTSTPWETFDNINDGTFNPGDSILFKRGDSWYGSLIIPSSGTKGNHIVIGAYGIGVKPLVHGGYTMSDTWTKVRDKGDGSLWANDRLQYTADWGDDGGYHTILNGDTTTWIYSPSYDTATMTMEYQYSHPTFGNGILYFFAPDNPATYYDKIIADSLSTIIQLNEQDYITIRDISVLHFRKAGIYCSYTDTDRTGLLIDNIYVGHGAMPNAGLGAGISVWYSNSEIKNSYITNCGRRGISMNTGSDFSLFMDSMSVHNNLFKNGFHTTSLDIGPGGSTEFRELQFYNNTVDDSEMDVTLYTTPIGVYMENQSSVKFKKLKIYNNIFIKPSGYAISAGAYNGTDSVYIDNNTIFGVNEGVTSTGGGLIYITGNSDSVFIRNNIIYNDIESTYPRNMFFNTGAGVSFAALDNNIHFQSNYPTHNTEILSDYGGSGSYYSSTFGDWQTYSGLSTNSIINDDPDFTSIVADSYDFTPLPASPAINAGVVIDYIEYDALGQPRNSTPTIGAIEFDPDSSQRYIKTFDIPDQVSSTIDTTNKTVAIVIPFGSSRISLTPTISLSVLATVSPTSGTAQNFTSAVTYTTTAIDGSTTDWTVAVTNEAPSTATDITVFSMTEQYLPASINASAHTISLLTDYGIDLSDLSPTISVSEGASVLPASGVSRDFTNPVTYTVTAQDELTSQVWTITVTTKPTPALHVINGKLVKINGSYKVQRNN